MKQFDELVCVCVNEILLLIKITRVSKIGVDDSYSLVFLDFFYD